MTQYDDTKYPRNFIKQVICRIDFLDYIEEEFLFDTTVVSEIIKSYSMKEKDQIMRFNMINIIGSNLNVSGQSIDGIQRTYTTPDGKNKIIISNKYIISEINNYDTFESIITNLQRILKAIFKRKAINVVRTGIRYINIYDEDQIKVMKKYFSQIIASTISTTVAKHDETIKMTRSIHLAQYSVDGMTLNFRFGLYNKNYPSTIKKNDFTLDFDCFTQEAINNTDEIIRYLKKGHDAIRCLFEGSITNDLRKVMNEVVNNE